MYPLHDLAWGCLSLVPALVFLYALYALDTYQLLPLRKILTAIGGGCLAAALALLGNTMVHARLGDSLGYWAAPILEECLKALFPLWCIYRHRVGFPVDAGIVAFATGAGFALVENLLYVQTISDGTLVLWLIRGLGTAIMHGTATALVAILAVTLQDQKKSMAAAACGLLIAIGLHILYNSGLLAPLQMAMVILVTAPALLAAVFWKSEQMLVQWLSSKLGEDLEVYSMIESSQFRDSKSGHYLQTLSASFPPEIVGDMLCLIGLSIELSAQAKGDLLKRKYGFEPDPDPTLPGKLKEMEYLERSLGPAGRMALAPLVPVRARDAWEMLRLAQRA